MKKFFTLLFLSVACLAQTPIGVKQNSFTTNSDPIPGLIISNTAASISLGQSYLIVSGAGDPFANGYYYQDGRYPVYFGWAAYSNSACYIWRGNPITGSPGAFLSLSSIFGRILYGNGGGTWHALPYYSGTPPAPTVTLEYVGMNRFINISNLQGAGALTVSNYLQYVDTNGQSAKVFQVLPPPSNPNLATQAQLISASNGIATATVSLANSASSFVTSAITNGLASTQYVNSALAGVAGSSVTNGLATLSAVTNISNTIYSNNQSKYITPPAVANMTAFGASVVSFITNGGGLLVSSNHSSSGISYTVGVDPSATNIVYITNINAITLGQWQVLTTNGNTWANYLAPINDHTNAEAYTNGLLSSSVASSTYQAKGSYLVVAGGLNYAKFSNPPAIPGTNGFVDASITNGLSSIPYVNAATNGMVTASITNGIATTSFVRSATNGAVVAGITNGLATISFVTNQNFLQSYITNYLQATSTLASVLSPYATTNSLAASSNYLSLANSTNVNKIVLHWGTNTFFVGSFNVNSNMTATYSTNNGVITATLGSTTNLYSSSGFQPASANLTNWSGINTNLVLLNTPPVIGFVAGNNVSVTAVGGQPGVKETITAYQAYNAPVQSAGFTITAPGYSGAGTTVNIAWANPLPAVPTTVKFYSGGADITSQVLSDFVGSYSFYTNSSLQVFPAYISYTASGILGITKSNSVSAPWSGQSGAVVGICK